MRTELQRVLTAPPDVLSSRMVGLIEGLAEDWRHPQEKRKMEDEIVAAKPGAAFDAKWGGGPIDPDFFTRLVYEGV